MFFDYAVYTTDDGNPVLPSTVFTHSAPKASSGSPSLLNTSPLAGQANVGAIAGRIIGGLAFLAGIGVVCLLYHVSKLRRIQGPASVSRNDSNEGGHHAALWRNGVASLSGPTPSFAFSLPVGETESSALFRADGTSIRGERERAYYNGQGGTRD